MSDGQGKACGGLKLRSHSFFRIKRMDLFSAMEHRQCEGQLPVLNLVFHAQPEAFSMSPCHVGKVYIVCFCVSKVETGDRVPQEHETPAIGIGMAGITNSAFLIQGKTCAQRGKVITEPSVLWDPFNVLFYLSQVGPKFEIHMGLPD